MNNRYRLIRCKLLPGSDYCFNGQNNFHLKGAQVFFLSASGVRLDAILRVNGQNVFQHGDHRDIGQEG